MSEQTVYKLLREGVIPRRVKIGKSVCFNKEVVMDWLRNGGVNKFYRTGCFKVLTGGHLNKAPRITSGYYSRNTKYSFSVDKNSLVKLLLDLWALENEVKAVLSE